VRMMIGTTLGVGRVEHIDDGTTGGCDVCVLLDRLSDFHSRRPLYSGKTNTVLNPFFLSHCAIPFAPSFLSAQANSQ
jgi:hypothetical protein